MNKKFIENLFYIDSIEGYNLALKYYNSNNDLIITDNPLLSNDPRISVNVADISQLINQKVGNKVGNIILSLSKDIEKTFKNKNYKIKFNYFTDKLGLYLSIRSMCNTVIEKSLIFSIFLKKYSIKNFKIIIPQSDYFDPINPWNFSRFSNIIKFLAKKSFFKNTNINIIEIDIDFPKNINDTTEKNIFLRVLVWPTPYIFYNIFNFLNVFLSKKKIIYYAKKCEPLSETLAWLFFKGYSIKSVNLPTFKKYQKRKNIKLESLLYRDLNKIIYKYLSLLSFSESQINVQKKIIIDHIYMGMDKLYNDIKLYEEHFKKNKFKYLLSAGFYGPLANQLFYLCKKYNVHLIGFEHGVTSSINYDTIQYLDIHESTTCNTLMVSSEMAQKEFENANSKNIESFNNKVFTMGEAEQKKKVFWHYLQKYILQKRFKIKSNEKTIVHISGVLYGGNLKNSPSSPIASYCYIREKKLLMSVYNHVNNRVLYKPYPAQRLLHQPSYADIFNLSKNIDIVGNFDFRYMRSIADIIVTDSNYSTLGWCILKNVPLIYLKSSVCYPLASNKLEKLFEEAFFVINIDNQGWEENLKLLLSKSYKDLLSRWNLKKTKRLKLIKDYIHGPKGNSSYKAANYINRFILKNGF